MDILDLKYDANTFDAAIDKGGYEWKSIKLTRRHYGRAHVLKGRCVGAYMSLMLQNADNRTLIPTLWQSAGLILIKSSGKKK